MCNQMFQYAFGYALARKYEERLEFDLEFYNNQPDYVGKRKVISQEQFSLLPKFQVTKRPVLVRLFENKYISHLLRYNSGCRLRLPAKVNFMMEKLHKYYSELPYQRDKINYYDGYWQTARYFKNYEEEIKQVFSPRSEITHRVKEWRMQIGKETCVAVHIRRGDYLNEINQRTLHGGNVIGDVDYYLRAIDYMKHHLDKPTFCFFSDDIEWCKQVFAKEPIDALFVENKGADAALLDLYSIAECEHGIMSPSSFSWWGNWLRTKKNSIVIGPKGEHSNEFFIDDDWIAL